MVFSLLMTDAVEKVARQSRPRNNRIEKASNLNHRCAGGRVFGSKLRRHPLKIFFNTVDPLRTRGQKE
jgi:hypothetical protein